MKVSTIMDFYVVLKENGAYPMILSRPWLTKSHANNYWGEKYMTIKVHINQQKVPFTNFVKNFKGTNEYDDLEIDQKFSFEGNFINIPMKRK